AQLDLARADASDVETIAEQAAQVLRLPGHHAADARGVGLRRADAVEDPDAVEDHAERVPQLVGEHGQELVLRATARLGLGARRPLGGEQTVALLLGAAEVGHVASEAPVCTKRSPSQSTLELMRTCLIVPSFRRRRAG